MTCLQLVVSSTASRSHDARRHHSNGRRQSSHPASPDGTHPLEGVTLGSQTMAVDEADFDGMLSMFEDPSFAYVDNTWIATYGQLGQ